MNFVVRVLRGVLPVAVALGVMVAATIILWRLRLTSTGSERLIYLYLLPVILIAILYTGRLAMFCAALALLFADYFLQDPLYSLINSNPLEYGDLICFAVLAGMAIKCVRMLMLPGARLPQQGSRFTRK